MENNIYTFDQDITNLRFMIDTLVEDVTPKATERTCSRMRAILDRIEEYRKDSYVPYDVKQYFRGGHDEK